MQRPGQRAIAGGHGREQIGLRRGHHARREGRGIHAVIAHGDEIGVERRRPRARRACGRASSTACRRRGSRSDRARSGRCPSRAAPARRRSPETRRRWWPRAPVRLRRADPRSPRESRRRSTGRACAGSSSGSRAKARSRAAPSAARTAASPIGWPVPPLHSRAVTPSKPVLRGEVADALAGDDQFAALAIDMAEHGFGGGNAVQADRGLGKLDVHGSVSFSALQRSALSTD